MKTSLLSVFILLGMLHSCKEKEQTPQKIHDKTERTAVNECYTAVYESDTLTLGLNTVKSTKITGNMEMKLAGQPIKTGTISGEFSGDTLFVHYTFTEVGNKDRVFKNPLALLKKDNQLILGKGEIETTMGASYFVKGKPIDFDRVKYKFSSADCNDVK